MQARMRGITEKELNTNPRFSIGHFTVKNVIAGDSNLPLISDNKVYANIKLQTKKNKNK
jgi:hypothetical protein